MMTITDKAAEKIKFLLAGDHRDPAEFGLRVGVEGGGCSGYQYRMDLTQAKEEDTIFEHNAAKVFVDPRSALFLGGSILDYVESLTGAGFTIRNPNATGTCGCGTSFSV